MNTRSLKGLKNKNSSKFEGYEFLEHTADAKFRAHGKSFEEALANAGKAMTSIMTDINKIKPKKTKKISLSSKTKESLVYDFFEKLIFLIDTEGFIAREFRDIHIKEEGKGNSKKYALTLMIDGDSANNYEIHTQIKSATYSDMKLEESEEECIIQAVLDI